MYGQFLEKESAFQEIGFREDVGEKGEMYGNSTWKEICLGERNWEKGIHTYIIFFSFGQFRVLQNTIFCNFFSLLESLQFLGYHHHGIVGTPLPR